MLFNSRSVAFLVALAVSLITGFAVSGVDGVDYWIISVGAFSTFLGTFTICYLILELLFFKELRSIYAIFEQAKGKNFKMAKSIQKPLNVMRKELIAYSTGKDAEINKLKQLESFRKEFLADISHELKTPIFSAQGFIHTLLDGAIDDENVRVKFLNKAAKSLDHLDTLVQDLMSISQLETGEIKMENESFDLVLLVNEVIEQLENKAKKREVNLSIRSNSGRLLVRGDVNRIMQVFKNLIDNAIKYGKEKGSVVVKLDGEGKLVKIAVSDDGPGIPEAHHQHLFKRFYRVDKSRSRDRGGTGLGLSIVKHIVEAHGAQISLKSGAGSGTKFSFTLPRAHEKE